MAAMIFLTVLCLVVILVSGYRLRNKGKPYGTLLLTIHKLIPLGMLAYLIITLRQMSPLSPLVLTLAILGAIFYLLLIASGGWISAAKEAPGGVKIVHKVLPYLAILATAVTLAILILEKA
jgi:hypothetical protein